MKIKVPPAAPSSVKASAGRTTEAPAPLADGPPPPPPDPSVIVPHLDNAPVRIAGFVKVRNEIIREGNLYRLLNDLTQICDGGVLWDDASTDGTAEECASWCREKRWTMLRARPEEQSFAREMSAKQKMLETVHAWKNKPQWIVWLDGDETVQDPHDFRLWLKKQNAAAVRMHYTQFWQNASWCRTDEGFDAGLYIKAWLYRPELSFAVKEGTHLAQFPAQIDPANLPIAPFELYHWGNYRKNMQWKAHQYAGGLGGVDRHIFWGHEGPSLATNQGYDVPYLAPRPTFRPSLFAGSSDGLGIGETAENRPEALPIGDVYRIRAMGPLRGLKSWFTVVVPAFNRAETLPAALDSLRAQNYPNWIAIVLDDGSTDETVDVMRRYQDLDPRIFTCRYLKNRGGVAMNEIGMSLACEMTEWWSRLGSDDTWGPGKLAADAQALSAGAHAVYGPFRVQRFGKKCEVCAAQPTGAQGALLRGQFAASWACVAVSCEALRQVRARFGGFCDPSLRNMEDFLVNARIAKVTEWRWRPGDPDDAIWNCHENTGEDAGVSASANAQQTAHDDQRTRQILAAEVGR